MTYLIKKAAGLILATSLIPPEALAQRAAEGVYASPAPAKRIDSVRALIAKQSDRLSAIESLYDKAIKKDDANLGALEELADVSPSVAERVAAIRILGLMYDPTNPQAFNERIRAKLRSLAQTANKDIATTAMLRYSRLPYAEDTESLLDLNNSRNFLTAEDTLAELAHIFPFAPQERQLHYLQRLADGNSAYALDILASNMKDNALRARLSSAARLKLIQILKEHQPGFSVAIGEFSLKEAIVFSDWLHVLASLQDEASLNTYDQVVLSYLDGATANPKRAISFLSSPEGKAAAARIGTAKLRPIFDRVEKYAGGLPFPQNSAARDFSSSVLNLRGHLTQ
jgi:hypothetical protein